MTPTAGKPVLSAAQMRAAEQAAIERGATVFSLMATAGQEVAKAVRRLAGANDILILCGPGNNGGDGYVAARHLLEWGLNVRVAALADPATDAARLARQGWTGAVEALDEARPAAILVDALFGTGGSRPLDASLCAAVRRLDDRALLSIAVDLPSGASTDDGALLGDIPIFGVTLALGATKPAHLLYPTAGYCGEVRVLDIGVPVTSDVHVMSAPDARMPGAQSHKYSRGMVAVTGGEMAGAAELAALAALRCGAGYSLLLTDAFSNQPNAIVRKRYSSAGVEDRRIGALVVGPGLGRGSDAAQKLDHALASPHPLLIDGDALHLLDEARMACIRARTAAVVLTPHAGEFETMFGKGIGSKIDRARAAAKKSTAIIVFKGPDTVVASPDGAVTIAPPANPWLSTAGTGDVLSGAIGAMLAANIEPAFEAACAGVWLHAAAARTLPGSFIADDLANALSAVRGAA